MGFSDHGLQKTAQTLESVAKKTTNMAFSRGNTSFMTAIWYWFTTLHLFLDPPLDTKFNWKTAFLINLLKCVLSRPNARNYRCVNIIARILLIILAVCSVSENGIHDVYGKMKLRKTSYIQELIVKKIGFFMCWNLKTTLNSINFAGTWFLKFGKFTTWPPKFLTFRKWPARVLSLTSLI